MSGGRPILIGVAAVSALALAVVIFLAYRQPALLLDFLNIAYCG